MESLLGAFKPIRTNFRSGGIPGVGRMPPPPHDVETIPHPQYDAREVSLPRHDCPEVSPTHHHSRKLSILGSRADHPFTTSWLLSPKMLALLRLLISLYCFATIFTVWIWQGSHADVFDIARGFSYFTNLTWWGLSIYFLAASVHGFVYVARGQSWLHRLPRLFQALYCFYYTTVVTLPILVTIVYWGFLHERTWFPVRFDAWSNVSKHGLNSFFALLEISLTTTRPPPFLHIPFLWVILGMYLGLAYITHWKQGWYTYSFLDPEGGKHNGLVAGYSIGIALATLVIFFIVWTLIWLRRRATVGREWKSGKDVGNFDESRMISGHIRSDDVDLEMRGEYV